MSAPSPNPFLSRLPWLIGAVCLLAYIGWLASSSTVHEPIRQPIQWNRAPAKKIAKDDDVTTTGTATAAVLNGSWPQFRGARRDNIAEPAKPLFKTWPATGPKVLWKIPVGEGYAGAAIHKGKVYLLDYDREKEREAIRCLSLANGEEIWRTTYPSTIKRNHGMTRTVPAVTNQFVVTFSPHCLVYCCDALTGRVVWKKDLKSEFGTVEPQWYAGQCPLIDGDRVIIAPAARPLMMAVDLATGKIVWQTVGSENMGMTHSSIVPATLGGISQYLYCTFKGVAGIAAGDGRVLWTYNGWKNTMAIIPAPVPVGDDRVFLTAGYNSGSKMIRLAKDGAGFKAEDVFSLKATEFSSEQHTPILYQDKLYATRSPRDDGELACLDPSGKVAWSSGEGPQFGLGPILMTADGTVFGIDDHTGVLHMGTIAADGYKELARAKVLDGVEPWAPMALADGRLIIRDMTEMKCLEVGEAQ
ncbi:PQQ-like beta-propeller repeat protein [bacterium]|nr:PQQ-like beta-propeller repeat protein [bacterium]